MDLLTIHPSPVTEIFCPGEIERLLLHACKGGCVDVLVVQRIHHRVSSLWIHIAASQHHNLDNVGERRIYGPPKHPQRDAFRSWRFTGEILQFESMLRVYHQPFQSSLDAARLQDWNVNQQFLGQFCAPKCLFLLTSVHWSSFLRYSDVCSWNASF